LPIYVLPMRHQFLFDEENIFKDEIINFIKSFASEESASEKHQ